MKSPLTFGKLNFSISSEQLLNLMDYDVREIQMRGLAKEILSLLFTDRT